MLDWTLFTLYLVVVLALGLKFAGEQHSNEDYFLGDRAMNWLPVGVSMFATTFSSLSVASLVSAFMADVEICIRQTLG